MTNGVITPSPQPVHTAAPTGKSIYKCYLMMEGVRIVWQRPPQFTMANYIDVVVKYELIFQEKQ